MKVDKILGAIGAALASVPKPIRDFVEGVLAVAIAGAASAVVGLNLVDPTLTPRTIELAAASGAIAAVIAYARRAITPPVTPSPPPPPT